MKEQDKILYIIDDLSDDEIKELFLKELEKLKNDFNNNKNKSFKELFEIYKGHYLEENKLFDFNFGYLCATIKIIDNKITLGNNYELYDTQGNIILTTYYE